MAALDVDTLKKYLKQPNGYLFPTPTAPRFNAEPLEPKRIPCLVTSAQVLTLYHKET